MAKYPIFVLILLILLFILLERVHIESPVGSVISSKSRPVLTEQTTAPEIFFCPKHDCAQRLEEYILNSNASVHCALYDLDLKDLITAFQKRSDIDVKIVLDDHNYFNLSFIRQDNENQLSHNKFCVFDSKIVWTGSFNPTFNGNFKNNNNVIVYESKYLAENFEAEFQELWGGVFSAGNLVRHPKIYINENLVENYFCPEDCVSGEQALYQVIHLIRTAKESVYFMTFSFTHDEIGDALLDMNDEIDIKGVFETTQAGSKYSQYHKLKEAGLDVITDSNPNAMHHKTFIIDKKIVITGSWNPTNSGTNRNDENILIIHDPEVAELFLEEFDLVIV